MLCVDLHISSDRVGESHAAWRCTWDNVTPENSCKERTGRPKPDTQTKSMTVCSTDASAHAGAQAGLQSLQRSKQTALRCHVRTAF
eukprot:4270161-Pleurochrysis_carterae.AAC.2